MRLVRAIFVERLCNRIQKCRRGARRDKIDRNQLSVIRQPREQRIRLTPGRNVCARFAQLATHGCAPITALRRPIGWALCREIWRRGARSRSPTIVRHALRQSSGRSTDRGPSQRAWLCGKPQRVDRTDLVALWTGVPHVDQHLARRRLRGADPQLAKAFARFAPFRVTWAIDASSSMFAAIGGAPHWNLGSTSTMLFCSSD